MAAAQRSPFLRSFAKHWMKPLTLIALMVPGLWLIWLWVQALTFNPVALGFDPVWFTVMFAVALQTSFLTPPFGFSLFYLRGRAHAPLPGRYGAAHPDRLADDLAAA